MKLKFTKMHGAGNDFIVFDDRDLSVPWHRKDLMAAMAARRLGIGCEGILLVQPPDAGAGADFRMRFLNPDGGEAEMCGNGARCAALFAYGLGAAGKSQKIQTRAGVLEAEILESAPYRGRVRLVFTPPSLIKEHRLLCGGSELTVYLLDTGVPHAVVFVDDARGADVLGLGRALRFHEAFAPAGANADFVEVLADGTLLMRTYERGVEDESGACGTGAVAAALVAIRERGLETPVRLRVASGDILEVGVAGVAADGELPTLSGPARIVCEGSVDTDAFAETK